MSDAQAVDLLAFLFAALILFDWLVDVSHRATIRRLRTALDRATRPRLAVAIPATCFLLANKVGALIAARRRLRTTRYVFDTLAAETLEGEVECLLAEFRVLTTRVLDRAAAGKPWAGSTLTDREQSVLAVALLAVATFRDKFPQVTEDAASIAAKLALSGRTIDEAKSWLSARAADHAKGGAA